MRKLFRVFVTLSILTALLNGIAALNPDPPEWLTSSGWAAGPWRYGYIQGMVFLPDGTGKMLFADSDQGPIEETDIRYEIHKAGRDRYKLDLTRFRGEVLAAYDVELLKGEFPVDVPYRGKVIYTRVMRFKSCPFGGPGNKDPRLLDYYGHEKRRG